MRILFAGTSAIGIPSLRALMDEHELVGLLTQPDRPVGRHQILTAPATKQFLEKGFNPIRGHCVDEPTGVDPFPIFQPETLRDVSFLEKFRAVCPEVMITMSYGKILPRELLELPSIACLNIHTSLLPRHRGATPIQGAILAGDEESGITIMHMAEGLDTGDILLQKKIKLAPDETTGSLTERLSKLAPESILEALSLLKKGNAPRTPQSPTGITYTRQIRRVDAAIDDTLSATKVDRLIRAMNPKPGAHGIFTLSSGKTIVLKIFAATIVSLALSEKPETLFLSEDRKLFLACNQGVLELHEVQPEGRARMSAAAFVSGYF